MNNIENGVAALAHDSVYDNYWGVGCYNEDEPACCIVCGKVLSQDDKDFFEDTCETCILRQEALELQQ